MSRPSRGMYPSDWKEIATRVKEEAGWTCIRCGHTHHVASGHVMTVHHLDLNKSNCAWWNLLPLCQRCHLSIQARVILERPWMFDHSPWFQPYVAGWYAQRYLGESLSRDEVMCRLDELLALEREALFGGAA